VGRGRKLIDHSKGVIIEKIIRGPLGFEGAKLGLESRIVLLLEKNKRSPSTVTGEKKQHNQKRIFLFEVG